MSEKPLRSVFEVYSVILFRGCWKKKNKTQLFLYEFTLMQRLMPSDILRLICIPFPPPEKTCRFVPSGTALQGCRGETISGCREMGVGGDKEWRLLLSAGTSSKWNHLAVWSPLGSLLLSLRSSSVAGRQTAHAKPSADVLQLEGCTVGPLKAGHLCDRNVCIFPPIGSSKIWKIKNRREATLKHLQLLLPENGKWIALI